VCRILESIGVNKIVSIDLHSGQLQGVFKPDVAVENLSARNVIVDYVLREKLLNDIDNCCIISPDAGAAGRARQF